MIKESLEKHMARLNGSTPPTVKQQATMEDVVGRLDKAIRKVRELADALHERNVDKASNNPPVC